MVAVHFITTLREPKTANLHIESNVLGKIRPCTNNSAYAMFEVFRIFCAFL